MKLLFVILIKFTDKIHLYLLDFNVFYAYIFKTEFILSDVNKNCKKDLQLFHK